MFWKRKKIERKERTDKKVHVQPTISVKLKAEIERLAYIVDQPIKNVGLLLAYEAIHKREIIELLAPYFRQGAIKVENTVYYSNVNNPSLRDTLDNSATDRISIRFTQKDMEDMTLVAHLLEVSQSRAVAILLEHAIKHHEIIEYILEKHNRRNSFDDVTFAEIRKLMKYVNKNNPYKTAWNQILLDVVGEGKQKVKYLAKKISRKAIDTETYKWDFD